MVIDSLYYSVHPFTNAANTSFSFNEDVIKDAVRRIYEKKFNPLTEIDEGIFNETWNIFNKATDEGFGVRGYSDPDYDFYQQIRYNNAVFAAFKTHRQQNDIAAQLLDDKGKLKPFSQFAADVEPITGKYNQQWLLTEYDTAVLRAHQAADWVQFGKVKDLFPNLRWMPTTSINPDLVHKQFWGIELTLPQDHPFWKKHRPGDRWNCKCSLEATDDEVTSAELIPNDGEVPDKGLDNNPGVDAKLFGDSHPYIEHANKGAKKAVENFIDNNVTSAERRKKYLGEMEQLLAKEVVKEVEGKSITVKFNRKGNKHLYSDTFGRAKGLSKDELKNLDKLLENAVFVKSSEITKDRKDHIHKFYYFKDKERKLYYNVAEEVFKGSVSRFLYSVTKSLKA